MLLFTSVMKVLCSVGMERTRPELVEALVAQLVLEAADICLENQLHTYGTNRHGPEFSGLMGYHIDVEARVGVRKSSIAEIGMGVTSRP